MDRKKTYPMILLAIIVAALACSVSAQQQPQQSNTVVAPPAPTPTPTPTPTPAAVCSSTTTKPSPTQQSYVFNTCIVAKFAAYLSVGSNKYVELKNGVVNGNSSRCGNNSTTGPTSPKLVIDFGHCTQLDFEFGQANTSSIFVKSINGRYTLENNVPKTFSNSTEMFKTTASDHYYKCNAEQSVVFDDSTQLVLSNLAFEAFRTASGTDFYKMAEECALDSSQVSDLVRIGVGIALVALVALVLIAYFVGRRRWAERSSYESV